VVTQALPYTWGRGEELVGHCLVTSGKRNMDVVVHIDSLCSYLSLDFCSVVPCDLLLVSVAVPASLSFSDEGFPPSPSLYFWLWSVKIVPLLHVHLHAIIPASQPVAVCFKICSRCNNKPHFEIPAEFAAYLIFELYVYVCGHDFLQTDRHQPGNDCQSSSWPAKQG